MPASAVHVQDRFRGALLGFAAGETLGASVRQTGMPRGASARGRKSDAVLWLEALAELAMERRALDGRSVAQRALVLWNERKWVDPPLSVRRCVAKLSRGVPWVSSGAELGIQDPFCLVAGVVLGLCPAAEEAEALHRAAIEVAVPFHKDPLCAAGVAAVARAVAMGVHGGGGTVDAWCEAIAAAAQPSSPALADELRYLPRALGWEADRALELLRKVGVPAAQLQGVSGLPAHITPVLLTALFGVLRSSRDFYQALAGVLRAAGGAVDVAAGLCGAVLGAHLGAEAIPHALRDRLFELPALSRAADQLLRARQTPARLRRS